MTTLLLAGLTPTLLIASGAAIVIGRKKHPAERRQERNAGPIRAKFSMEPQGDDVPTPPRAPAPKIEAVSAPRRSWFGFGRTSASPESNDATEHNAATPDPAIDAANEDADATTLRVGVWAKLRNAIPFGRTRSNDADSETFLDALARDLHLETAAPVLAGEDQQHEQVAVHDDDFLSAPATVQHVNELGGETEQTTTAVVAVLDKPIDGTERETTRVNGATHATLEAETSTVGGTVDNHGAIVIDPPQPASPDLEKFAASADEASQRFSEERITAQLLAEKRTRSAIAGAPWWMRLLPTMEEDDITGRRRLASSLRRVGAEWSLALILTAYQQETDDTVRGRLLGALAAHSDLIDQPSLVAFMRAAEARSVIEAAAVGELGYAEVV